MKSNYKTPVCILTNMDCTNAILQDSGDAGMFPVNPIERDIDEF